jgi:hypothetical protein
MLVFIDYWIEECTVKHWNKSLLLQNSWRWPWISSTSDHIAVMSIPSMSGLLLCFLTAVVWKLSCARNRGRAVQRITSHSERQWFSATISTELRRLSEMNYISMEIRYISGIQVTNQELTETEGRREKAYRPAIIRYLNHIDLGTKTTPSNSL